MKVVYLSQETMAVDLHADSVQAKNQNKYGTMYNFKQKLELVTSDQITDYHIFTTTENKLFLCVKSPQLQNALNFIMEQQVDHVFNPQKEVLYIRMNAEQAANMPMSQMINISVNVYGMFYQTSTKTSFLQVELTGFKSYPLVEFP